MGDHDDRAQGGHHRPAELIPRWRERASRLDFGYEVAAGEQILGIWPAGGEGQTVWKGVLLVLGEEKVTSSRPPRSSWPFLVLLRKSSQQPRLQATKLVPRTCQSVPEGVVLEPSPLVVSPAPIDSKSPPTSSD